ncbi:MAG TPA: type II toxin-antitoxin system VapC family toxin [Herpetosiphonaceae bacterium]
MAGQLLLDTDVLIDYLRAHTEAVTYITSLSDSLSISVITVAELYAGVRDGAERAALEVFIRAFLILPINHDIAVKGGLYRRDYGKSHSVGLADALIGATVEHHQATLVTLNNKHFPMLTNVVVPYQKP